MTAGSRRWSPIVICSSDSVGAVEVGVEEGRLVEFSPPDFSVVARRAFGEFTGANGELASYALGWTTRADDLEGRLTVAIGVGNPGGATFHARVLPYEGESDQATPALTA